MPFITHQSLDATYFFSLVYLTQIRKKMNESSIIDGENKIFIYVSIMYFNKNKHFAH